ncbi:MAG: preprotein translocase subunit SecE [Thermodesulfobacteriota bacterium]
MIKIGKAKQFVSESRQELKKVTWPSKQQTMNSTWIVIAVTALLAAFMGIVDMGLAKIVGLFMG